MGYEVKLDVFEGPLDLLLFLIKKNELNIYDIPIAEITDQYLQYVELMRSLNLDLAGEYLLLAATLLHIKSRLLLPTQEYEEDTEDDPRLELVEQLVTYQACREAAHLLDSRPQLGREVFVKGARESAAGEETHPIAWEEVGLFELIDAFQRIVSRLKPAEVMEIQGETVTLRQKIEEIIALMTRVGSMSFEELIGGQESRRHKIYTFLALLELVRRRVIYAVQDAPFSSICICYRGERLVPDG